MNKKLKKELNKILMENKDWIESNGKGINAYFRAEMIKQMFINREGEKEKARQALKWKAYKEKNVKHRTR